MSRKKLITPDSQQTMWIKLMLDDEATPEMIQKGVESLSNSFYEKAISIAVQSLSITGLTALLNVYEKKEEDFLSSLLPITSKNENPELTRALLKGGANPNYIDAKHGSPLFYAAAENSHSVIEILIEAGADILKSLGNDWRQSPACLNRYDKQTFSMLEQAELELQTPLVKVNRKKRTANRL